MTVTVYLTVDTRKLVQSFAGCTDTEHGERKAVERFPGCKIQKSEEKKDAKAKSSATR
jgi:hypothetical protein